MKKYWNAFDGCFWETTGRVREDGGDPRDTLIQLAAVDENAPGRLTWVSAEDLEQGPQNDVWILQ